MDSDLALVIGVIVSVLALPSIVSAISDGRAPRAAAIAVLIGGGLVVFAVSSRAGGYTVDELPEVFYRVVSRFI
ncbi:MULTISPECIES: hypothetical protein [unclassified Marinovum]